MTEPKPFSQTWSLDDTKARLSNPDFPRQGTPLEQETWRRTVGRDQDIQLAERIGQHLAFLIKEGTPLLPPYSEHVSTWLLHALRELVLDPSNTEKQTEAGLHFARSMPVSICFFKSENDTQTPESIHEKLMQVVSEGRFSFDAADTGPCFLSGLRISVLFKNWCGEAGTLSYEPIPDSFRSKKFWAPLTEGEIRAQTTETTTIPVPSGSLLVSDWFRIPQFNAIAKSIDDDPSIDINTVAGRAKTTQRYAEELGVLHVSVRSPSILQDEGVIKAGFLDSNQKTPRNFKGSICADLRWTTLVDRDVLINLLSQKMERAVAEETLSDYIKKSGDVIELSTYPGTYHLYFAGSSDLFQKTVNERFDAERARMTDFSEPSFCLTREPLEPKFESKPSTPKSTF